MCWDRLIEAETDAFAATQQPQSPDLPSQVEKLLRDLLTDASRDGNAAPGNSAS